MHPTPPLDHHWSIVSGLRCHAWVAARGATPGALPVVLVHGFVISSRYMRPTLRRLAAMGRETWAVDLPGHGRSATPPRALDVPGYADALVAWMDAAGLERAVLVGNSLGAQIIVQAAVRHPSRVAGLVLAGPTVDARARSLWKQALRLLADIFFERPSLVLLEAADILRVGPVRILAMARATLDDRIEQALPRVAAPVRVVRGARDPLVPAAWAARVAMLARAGAPIEIPGTGHGINYSAPEALSAIVEEFAREVAALPR